jgi:hypothetical protein
LSARLLNLGYIYKFEVDVYGINIFFEKDDEGNYRATIDPDKMSEKDKIDVGLLETIAAFLETNLH